MKQTVYTGNNPIFSELGGMLIRTIIVIISLFIVGGAIYIVLINFGTDQQINHRKALAISEYGLMEALQKVQSDPSATEGIPKTSYDKGWYAVSLHRYVQNDTVFLTVSSEGHAGPVTERRECILRLEASGADTSWVRESLH